MRIQNGMMLVVVLAGGRRKAETESPFGKVCRWERVL